MKYLFCSLSSLLKFDLDICNQKQMVAKPKFQFYLDEIFPLSSNGILIENIMIK